MEPWQFYLILIVQVITSLMAIILAILIYKRNPNYKGNVYLSVGFLLYSLYPLGCFFYELGINDQIVQISMRASLLGTILGSGSFLVSMTIFCVGEKSDQLKKYNIPLIALTILACIIILLPNSIVAVEIYPTSCERSIILMGTISTYIIVSTGRMIYLLSKTVRNIPDENSPVRKKLRTFRLALIISLGIMTFSIIENITQIHFFNLFNYLFLLLTYIIISQPILKKQVSSKMQS